MEEKKYTFSYKHYTSLNSLSAEDKKLVRQAQEACKCAYAPFSRFKVGAALRMADGEIITSSNQESPVLAEGMCAERGLLYYAQANNHGQRIVSLAIVSSPGKNECYPCGACRQVLVDTEKRQTSPIRIIMCSEQSATVVKSALDLLPFTFQL